jgi:anti-sigma B factor antagonist
MKIQIESDLLRVTDLKELGASNATAFRDRVRSTLPEKLKIMEIDLSLTAFVDSCGLGALIALHKTMCARNGVVRLLNPTAPVRQILELTRMHRIFEVIKR